MPWVALGLALAACSAPVAETAASATTDRTTVAFDYPALDGTRLSSMATRGRRTVLLFVTTYDLASQVAVRVTTGLVRSESPRINAGVVVLEPPRNEPLVEAFAASLEIPFPVALADAATLAGRGPFGEIVAVPTTLVLDATGGVVLRREGALSAAELHEALERALR